MARVELRTSAGISVATLPLAPIFGAGFAVGQLVERKLRAKRVGPTCGLVEAWNERFFRPRNLDVLVLFLSLLPSLSLSSSCSLPLSLYVPVPLKLIYFTFVTQLHSSRRNEVIRTNFNSRI